MNKRLALAFGIVCLILAMVMPEAGATETTEPTAAPMVETTVPETRDPYACGADLTWRLDGGTLTISGSGPMDDFSGGAPWADYRSSITTVVFSGAVTTVGAGAFRDYDNLTAIDFGGAMYEIGAQAFQSCDSLTTISLPATFRRFGEECFQGCKNLTQVHCAGGMPNFRNNCLWNGNQVTLYCPQNNPWPEQYVLELEENFGGRLTVLTSDGADPYDAEQPEQTVPETTEQPTVEATTEPAPIPTTQAATEPATMPAQTEQTQPQTQTPETQQSEETALPTEETQPEEKTPGRPGSWIGIALIGLVLGLLAVGAVIFRKEIRRGGKYSSR